MSNSTESQQGESVAPETNNGETPSGESWWGDFFRGLWLEVQRRTKSHELTVKEIDFLERAYDLPKGAKLVDAPCGVGRHSIELASRGYNVTGIDITEPFVEDARASSKEAGVQVDWRIGDMRKLPQDSFDVVTCLWGSFGYFEDDGNREHVAAAFAALKPGGQFLFDTHTTETLLPKIAEARAWRQVDDIMILEERRFDLEGSRTVTDWTLIRGDERFEDTTSIRLYSYREIVMMLRDAGFEVETVSGSLDGAPFTLGSSRLFIGARKPA